MWTRTDELQFVKKESDNEFNVLETIVLDDKYFLNDIHVNIESYSEDELQYEVNGFYSSLDEVKEIYKDNWKQVVAECIAKNESSINNGIKFNSVGDLCFHLWTDYKIDIHAL